jgi:hypothetical protein
MGLAVTGFSTAASFSERESERWNEKGDRGEHSTRAAPLGILRHRFSPPGQASVMERVYADGTARSRTDERARRSADGSVTWTGLMEPSAHAGSCARRRTR